MTKSQDIVKRLFDFTVTSFGLIAISPILILIAGVIKISTKGPVFYSQTRIGKNRKEFQMIKFRSMVPEADKMGPLVTARHDNRITTIGKLLRRTKFDELPELINVIKGDLSLVGPRPEVTLYTNYHKHQWERVLSVKPGITDLATLQFRDEETVLEFASDREQAYIDVVLPIKLQLACEYVEKWSFWLDIKILILTVWAITFGRIFAKPNRNLAESTTEKVRNHKQRSKDLE